MKKSLIVECDREKGDFISSAILQEKKGFQGSVQAILNSKHLSQDVKHKKCKFISLSNIVTYIKKNVVVGIASVVLKIVLNWNS